MLDNIKILIKDVNYCDLLEFNNSSYIISGNFIIITEKIDDNTSISKIFELNKIHQFQITKNNK